jgi:hypothetical protein
LDTNGRIQEQLICTFDLLLNKTKKTDEDIMLGILDLGYTKWADLLHAWPMWGT